VELVPLLQEDRKQSERGSVDETHRQGFAGQELLAEAACEHMDLSCPLHTLDESRPSQLGPPRPISREIIQNCDTLSAEERLRLRRRWCLLTNLSDKPDGGLPEL
jgi:hypothetical protein